MKKLYTSKTFPKRLVEGGISLMLPPLGPPLAISYNNHQKSLAYFSHMAPFH